MPSAWPTPSAKASARTTPGSVEGCPETACPSDPAAAAAAVVEVEEDVSVFKASVTTVDTRREAVGSTSKLAVTVSLHSYSDKDAAWAGVGVALGVAGVARRLRKSHNFSTFPSILFIELMPGPDHSGGAVSSVLFSVDERTSG